MTDELDEILNIHTIDAGNRVLKLIDVNEAKQAIQALIDQECTKARIDERSQAQQYLHGLTITPESQHLFDVLSRNNYDRIKEIKRSKE